MMWWWRELSRTQQDWIILATIVIALAGILMLWER